MDNIRSLCVAAAFVMEQLMTNAFIGISYICLNSRPSSLVALSRDWSTICNVKITSLHVTTLELVGNVHSFTDELSLRNLYILKM